MQWVKLFHHETCHHGFIVGGAYSMSVNKTWDADLVDGVPFIALLEGNHLPIHL